MIVFTRVPTPRLAVGGRLDDAIPKRGLMALRFRLVDAWDDGRRIHLAGTIAASGSYTTGGDSVDLSQNPVVASSHPPIAGTAWMEGLAGYDDVFQPGSAINSGTVKIFQQGSSADAFQELAAGLFPDDITSDAITFYGIFRKPN